MDTAASRRFARAAWTMVVHRAGDGAPSEEDDTRFWLRVPVSERAALTWELSKEVFALAARNGGAFDEDLGATIDPGDLSERRLPRTAFRVTRC